jgi:hypothetical protein
MAKLEPKLSVVGESFQYVKADSIRLKGHPRLGEAWLQNIIADDPSILGFGDLQLIQRERRQHSGGRLDLLLSHTELNRRYEVELQLGATDESHLIRCLEYWDVERKRYPSYEHYPVLIAEDITSRFLNIISLFAGSVPLIALQMTAHQHEGKVFLNFVKVIDQTSLREDDETPEPQDGKDRNYWLSRGSETSMAVADEMLEMINEFTKVPHHLTYMKVFIGLTDKLSANNFVRFILRKPLAQVLVRVSDKDGWLKRLQDAGVDAELNHDGKTIRLPMRPDDILKHKRIIKELLKQTVLENE